MENSKIESPEVSAIQIQNSSGKILVKVHYDGTIEYGEDYDPTEAARIFWNAISTEMPDRVKDYRP